MNITFDAVKEAANLAKHGISLAMASELEWETALIWPDKRRDYGEIRMIGHVLKSTRLYCVVFTDRGQVRRIISLRKANEREVRDYVAQN